MKQTFSQWLAGSAGEPVRLALQLLCGSVATNMYKCCELSFLAGGDAESRTELKEASLAWFVKTDEGEYFVSRSASGLVFSDDPERAMIYTTELAAYTAKVNLYTDIKDADCTLSVVGIEENAELIEPTARKTRQIELNRLSRIAAAAEEWRTLSVEDLRSRCGDITPKEIRTVRGVLRAIIRPDESTNGDITSE